MIAPLGKVRVGAAHHCRLFKVEALELLVAFPVVLQKDS